MDNNNVKTEYKRLVDLLRAANIPQQKISVLEPVIDNMAWQRVKLDEARAEMQDASIICEYNNGGGQTGTRENPVFKAYINLWRAYMVGLEKFSSYLPKELHDEVVNDGMSILEQVKQMKSNTNGERCRQ